MSRPNTRPLLAALAAATLTASLGISTASVLLPDLARAFAAPMPQVQWVVLAYLTAITVAVVSAGRLGDIFGPRRVLLSGLALFTLASIAAALAPSLPSLVAARAVQGGAGAVMIALPMSLARNRLPEGRLGTAMGLLGTTSAIGTALGPSMGGLLLAWADWRAAFWLLAATALASLAMALSTIPASPRAHRATWAGTWASLDAPGTLLLILTLTAYALATSGTALPARLPPGLLLATALGAGALFVLAERRARAPLLPLALLRSRATGTGLAMNTAVGTIMMSTLVVGPFYLAFALGLGPAQTGLVLATGPFVAALTGLPAGWLTDRLGAARTMQIGLAQTVLGLVALALLPRALGTPGYVLALTLLTPAFQLFLAGNNTAVLAAAPEADRGRISGLLALSRNLGLMTGASAMPALFVIFQGTPDPAQAAPEAIARAFSLTFLAAAGLALATLVLALTRRPQTGHADAPS